MGGRIVVRYDLDLLEVSKMAKVRCTVVWLVLAGLMVACTLSGCKKETEETPTGGTETSQTETADPNA
jgi:hypothetical protein